MPGLAEAREASCAFRFVKVADQELPRVQVCPWLALKSNLRPVTFSATTVRTTGAPPGPAVASVAWLAVEAGQVISAPPAG